MGKPKILVVDDDEDIRETLKYRLESNGYQIITACDGIEALEYAHLEHPDLILLDIILPKIDGYQICRALKESTREEFNRIPIIMITARARLIDEEIQAASGAADYIVKPFNANDLLAKIGRLLGEKVVNR